LFLAGQVGQKYIFYTQTDFTGARIDALDNITSEKLAFRTFYNDPIVSFGIT
jgi:hypothetical protein